MDRISDRHEGDLAGRLAPFAATRRMVVAITVPADLAGEAACQHAAWMLTNLLARSDRIVERVVIVCPEGIPLSGRIVPLADRHVDLAGALRNGAAAIDVVPVEVGGAIPSGATRLVVGPGDPVSDGMRVHGERWWGGISTGGIDGSCDSPLPFGSYAAATLAAGEIFKAARMRDYPGIPDAYYSFWAFRATSSTPDDANGIGPQSLDDVPISATLAGVGAVGSTWVHVMWATTGIHGEAALSDSDGLGVDASNLNRCPVFGRVSLGRRKASEATRICNDAPLRWRPYDGSVTEVDERPPMLLSAVDTNESREAIQGLYPARLISASTLDMRAELLRCDPIAEAACIRCFNPVRRGPTDQDLRRQFLDMAPPDQERLAVELSFTMAEARSWAIDGTCGYVGDRIAAILRPTSDDAQAFAVGFVSVMAGTMLAAQTIKDWMGEGPLDGMRSRAVMQFLDPTSMSNAVRLYGRDPVCPMCDPGRPAAAVWRRRHGAFRFQT